MFGSGGLNMLASAAACEHSLQRIAEQRRQLFCVGRRDVIRVDVDDRVTDQEHGERPQALDISAMARYHRKDGLTSDLGGRDGVLR
jgi:hypothetical protein